MVTDSMGTEPKAESAEGASAAGSPVGGIRPDAAVGSANLERIVGLGGKGLSFGIQGLERDKVADANPCYKLHKSASSMAIEMQQRRRSHRGGPPPLSKQAMMISNWTPVTEACADQTDCNLDGADEVSTDDDMEGEFRGASVNDDDNIKVTVSILLLLTFWVFQYLFLSFRRLKVL